VKKFSFSLVLVLLLAALTAPAAWASLTLITDRAALGADMSVDWGVLGAAPDTIVSNPFTLGSVTVSMSGTFKRRDQGNGGDDWNGNFSPGDRLIRTRDKTGPMIITFSTPVYGAGANIQEDLHGSFVAQIEIFSGSNSLGILSLIGNSNGGNNGSAIFLGVSSSTPFTAINYLVTNPTNGDFAINQLGIRTTPVPLPPSVLLFGTGLLIFWRNRRKK